jgi:hypothetical protein
MADATKPKRDRWKYLRQMRDNYRLAKQIKPALGWILLGIFLSIFTVFVVIGILFNNPITFILIGLPLATVPTTWYFSRVAMRAAYAQVEDQPGGAAAVAQAMRGNWSVTPGVNATRNQDLVHRAVGRPGVVLISEGPPSRVQHLLNSEAKRTARYVPDIPIHTIQSGTGEGQVPVNKLQKALGKLPKALTPGEVTAVRRRLDALKTQPVAGIPKGPVPRSAKAARKGQRPM